MIWILIRKRGLIKIQAQNGGSISLKVIFLDIDGVLNSNFWNEKHQKEMSDGTLIDNNLKPIRKEAALLLEMFSSENMEIYDVTPDLTTEEIRKTKKFSLVKAQEILSWVALHKEIEKWIVIDDLDLHNETIYKHQIRTDQTVGLTRNDVENAIHMLEEGQTHAYL